MPDRLSHLDGVHGWASTASQTPSSCCAPGTRMRGRDLIAAAQRTH